MEERTNPFARDILIQFEDSDVNQTQCTFIEDRLDNYHLYLDRAYSVTNVSEYDSSKEMLLLGVVITIPDRLIPEDLEKLTQLRLDLIEGFEKYYERSIQFLNINERNGVRSNQSYNAY